LSQTRKESESESEQEDLGKQKKRQSRLHHPKTALNTFPQQQPTLKQ